MCVCVCARARARLRACMRACVFVGEIEMYEFVPLHFAPAMIIVIARMQLSKARPTVGVSKTEAMGGGGGGGRIVYVVTTRYQSTCCSYRMLSTMSAQKKHFQFLPSGDGIFFARN